MLMGCTGTPTPEPEAPPADSIPVADPLVAPSADTIAPNLRPAPTDSVLSDSLAALVSALRVEVAQMRAMRDSVQTVLSAAATAPPDTAPPDTAPPDTAASPGTAATDTTATDEPTLREARDTAQHFGLRLFGSVLVLVATYFVVRFAVYILDLLAERSAERRLLYKRIVPIIRVFLWTLSLYLVLRGIFHVDAQGLLAAATAIGVAVGFAAQDLLKNIFGGLVIIFDQPFQVGDKIQIGDTYGEVVNIGLRSMRIVTPGDNLVSVPNAQIVDSAVSNANAGALDCQVTTDLYLPGHVDEALAKQLAYEAAASAQYVYLEKPIVVMVTDEWEERHRLHLKVKAYVLDARHEFRLASEVTERARRAFRTHGLLPSTAPASKRPAHGNGRPPSPASDASAPTDSAS